VEMGAPEDAVHRIQLADWERFSVEREFVPMRTDLGLDSRNGVPVAFLRTSGSVGSCGRD